VQKVLQFVLFQNVFSLIKSNTDVLTGGASSIVGTQKKFIENLRLEYLNQFLY
jgi:hypothetical protein